MSMSYIKKTLEDRIISTLKMNPQMTYLDALEAILRSMGIINSCGLLVNSESIASSNGGMAYEH